MPHEIQIRNAGRTYTTKSFTFPGGELQVQIPELPHAITGDVTVLARLQSADDFVRLLLTTEVLSRVHRAGPKHLVIPYFPYARQDRVMQRAEAFSLKAVARVINALGYDDVVTCDPHSDVTPALVDNLQVVAQVDLVGGHEELCALLREPLAIVVAPDAGAAKKAFAVAQRFSLPLVTASKVRNTSTGGISGTEVTTGPSLAGRDAVIVDDICDGGRTFIELAKVLRTNGARRVFLSVTHGIFSQGLGVFVGLIDGIYTTDTFLSEHVTTEQDFLPLHISTVPF